MDVTNELAERHGSSITAFLNWASSLKNNSAASFEQVLLRIERGLQDRDNGILTAFVTRLLTYWLHLLYMEERDFGEMRAFAVLCEVDAILGRPQVSTAFQLDKLRTLQPLPPADWDVGDASVTQMEIGSFIAKIGKPIGPAGPVRASVRVLSVPSSEELDISIVFRGKKPLASDVGLLIFAFSELFTMVEGAQIHLEDLGRGSFWVRFRVSFRDFFRRKEVRELLTNARDAVEAKYLKKEIEEAERIRAERRKMDVERELLERELADKKAVTDASLVEAQLRELEYKERTARLRALELDNIGKTLDLKMKVVAMIREGMLSADPVDIYVEDSLLLRAKNGEITKGSDLPKKLDTPPDKPEGAVA